MNQVDPLSLYSPADGLGADRLQQILNALPHPVMLFSSAGQIYFANARARQLFGEPGAQRCCHYAHGELDDEGSRDCPFTQVLLTRQPAIIERTMRDSSGKLRHVQITVAPLLDDAGRIESLLETHHDVTEQREEAQRLHMLQGHLLELAHRDALTGLANRRYLELKLERLATENAQRQCALLYADLDHFKPVNDVHGHIAGDAVLATVASRLRHALRGTDLLARVGGDEFAILLEGVTESGARAVGAKIIAALADPVPSLPEPNQIGVSIGICLFRTGSVMPLDLLRHADQAMYRAKRRGGGQSELLVL